MNSKNRLTVQYREFPVPKELCNIDKDTCKMCDEICNETLCCDCPIQKCFSRLAELEDKIENGILVEPPCGVGDTVYATKGHFYLPHATKIKSDAIIPCEVIGVKRVKSGNFILLKPLLEETFNKRSANKWFPFSAMNKTVFLTSEEVDQKLKNAKLEKVKEIINKFVNKEYACTNGADFSDLTNVGIAHTNLGDNEEHEVQVSVDLVNFAVNKYYDGELIEHNQYKNLDELTEFELNYLNFDDLVSIDIDINGSFTAFAYEDDGITVADLATYDTAEEAIEFAKAHNYDEVVNDITGKIIYRR